MSYWCRRSTWGPIMVALAATAVVTPATVVGEGGRHHGHPRPQRQMAMTAAFQVYLPAWWAGAHEAWNDQHLPALASADANFHSQDHEDEHLLDNYFHGKTSLFYLEMGGLNGVTYSNTLYLQQALSWRGILIEPNPYEFKEMVANRKHDICVNAAICDVYKEVHFINAGAVGGILEFMSEDHKNRTKHDAKKAMVIPCLPLESILAKLNILHIDFWSLDVEGAELGVLKTFNWNAVSVDVIVVEHGYDYVKEQAMIDILVEKGYIHDGRLLRNNWFHHSKFIPSVNSTH